MTLHRSRYRSIAVAAVLGVLTLTACGSDDGEADTAEDTAQTDQPTDGGLPSGGPGMGNVDFEAIQECLTAAGLDDVLPTDMPTDIPTDMPTDMPSDFPTDGTPPSGVPSGDGGGMGALQDPEVQAALDACGIELPQAPGAGQS